MAIRLPVDIDGSRGEGGGQILRTSLALAIITNRQAADEADPRRAASDRACSRQHLACVKAAARLCNGRATAPGGASSSSGMQELELVPGGEQASVIEIDIGTAGSTTLLIQTLLVPALASGKPLRVEVTGGTHNPLAPPFEFLDRVFVPHLRAMGGDVTLTLGKHGFLPKGGGKIVMEIGPLEAEADRGDDRGRGRRAPRDRDRRRLAASHRGARDRVRAGAA